MDWKGYLKIISFLALTMLDTLLTFSGVLLVLLFLMLGVQKLVTVFQMITVPRGLCELLPISESCSLSITVGHTRSLSK